MGEECIGLSALFEKRLELDDANEISFEIVCFLEVLTVIIKSYVWRKQVIGGSNSILLTSGCQRSPSIPCALQFSLYKYVVNTYFNARKSCIPNKRTDSKILSGSVVLTPQAFEVCSSSHAFRASLRGWFSSYT